MDPNKAESIIILFWANSGWLIGNVVRWSSAQDRQFKSKTEEDRMIVNINTILLTVAMYEIINLSIRI